MSEFIFTTQKPATGLFLVLVLIAIALMTVIHRHPEYSPITVPLRVLLSQQVSNAHTHFQSESAWQAENAQLQEKLLQTQVTLQALQGQLAEDSTLRELLHLQQTALPTGVVARVVTITGDPDISHYTLNKGLDDGIRVGAPVVSQQGVLGQIVSSSAHESQVMLLTEKRSAIPVKNLRTGWLGIAEGTGHGTLQLRHVLHTIALQAEDTLVTSGLDHVFPLGLPVATVATLKQGHPFSVVTLTPVNDVQRQSFVLVIGVRHAST